MKRNSVSNSRFFNKIPNKRLPDKTKRTTVDDHDFNSTFVRGASNTPESPRRSSAADATVLWSDMNTTFTMDNESAICGPLNSTFNLGIHSSTSSPINTDITYSGPAVGTLVDISKTNMDESLGLLSFKQMKDFTGERSSNITTTYIGDDFEKIQEGDVSEYTRGKCSKMRRSLSPQHLTPKVVLHHLSSTLNTTNDRQDLNLTEELFNNANMVIAQIKSKSSCLIPAELAPGGTHSCRKELDEDSMLFDQSITLCDLTVDDSTSLKTSNTKVVECKAAAECSAELMEDLSMISTINNSQFPKFISPNATLGGNSSISLYTSSTDISLNSDKKIQDGKKVMDGSLSSKEFESFLTRSATNNSPVSSVAQEKTSSGISLESNSTISRTIDTPSCSEISVFTSSSAASSFKEPDFPRKIKPPKYFQKSSRNIGSREATTITKPNPTFKCTRVVSRRSINAPIMKTGCLRSVKESVHQNITKKKTEFKKQPSKKLGCPIPKPNKGIGVNVKSNSVGLECLTVPSRNKSTFSKAALIPTQSRVPSRSRGADIPAAVFGFRKGDTLSARSRSRAANSTSPDTSHPRSCSNTRGADTSSQLPSSRSRLPDSLVAPLESKAKAAIVSTISGNKGKIPVVFGRGRNLGSRIAISSKVAGPFMPPPKRPKTAAAASVVATSPSKTAGAKHFPGYRNFFKPETTVTKGSKPKENRAGNSAAASTSAAVVRRRPITQQTTVANVSQPKSSVVQSARLMNNKALKK